MFPLVRSALEFCCSLTRLFRRDLTQHSYMSTDESPSVPTLCSLGSKYSLSPSSLAGARMCSGSLLVPLLSSCVIVVSMSAVVGLLNVPRASGFSAFWFKCWKLNAHAWQFPPWHNDCEFLYRLKVHGKLIEARICQRNKRYAVHYGWSIYSEFYTHISRCIFGTQCGPHKASSGQVSSAFTVGLDVNGNVIRSSTILRALHTCDCDGIDWMTSNLIRDNLHIAHFIELKRTHVCKTNGTYILMHLNDERRTGIVCGSTIVWSVCVGTIFGVHV